MAIWKIHNWIRLLIQPCIERRHEFLYPCSHNRTFGKLNRNGKPRIIEILKGKGNAVPVLNDATYNEGKGKAEVWILTL